MLPGPISAPKKWDRFAKIARSAAQYAHPALDRLLCCYESDTRAWLWAVTPCRKSPPVTAVHLRGRIHHPFLFPPSSFLPLSFLFLPPPSSLLSSFPSLLSSPLFLSLPPFPPSFSSPPSPPSLSLLSLPSLSFPFSFPSLSFPSLLSLLPFPPSLPSLFSPLPSSFGS